VADGVVDEQDGLGGIGEVGGDEENVVGGLDGSAIKQGVAGGDELFDVSGGKNQFGAGATVAIGQGEAESAGAAGDEDDLAGASGGAGLEGVSGGRGDDAGENLSGVKDGPGFLHELWEAG
jgi:hypothetical protein